MKTLVLVTGATGFVGRQILASLLKAGVELRLVVRDGSETRLPWACDAEIVSTPDLFKEREVW